MENKKIIRAADYLPKPKNGDSDGYDYELPMSEHLLISIFGDSPDYSKRKFEKIWQKFIDAEDEDTIAYCLERGVDVIGDDGEPVDGWRDIAVMLKAIERGILKLDKK
jgi:hypothetical protein